MRAGHDVVIRGGTIYDGSGGAPFGGDVAIDGDRIAEIGKVSARARNEIDRMRALVDAAMRGGALGVGSALIYSPATYADTDELVALAEIAGRLGGMYITHMRSEGNRLVEAVDEVIEIARRARLPAEIYHLKQAGRSNWNKLDPVIDRIPRARADGLALTADLYQYEAGRTGPRPASPPLPPG